MSVSTKNRSYNYHAHYFFKFDEQSKYVRLILSSNCKFYVMINNSITLFGIDICSCCDSCEWALSPLVNKF